MGDNIEVDKLKKILLEYRPEEGNLTLILENIQEKYGYISEEAIKEVATYLELPISQINATIKYNKRLVTKKQANYIITVCLGKNCYKNGARSIIDIIKKELKIGIEQTTQDNKFTLKTQNCLKNCSKGPSVKINDILYSNVTREKMKELIGEYKNKL
ncbi:MAG: hypothetical protein HFJ53_00860 [Clostridia bacterium]|jgi:NADH:ubiquinone oxidoreductase subunit E|nr:hypothetical protein [Clostridia bacterium]